MFGAGLAYGQQTAIKPPSHNKPNHHKPHPNKPPHSSSSSSKVKNTQPLTQYFIVEVKSYGVGFRSVSDLTRMLKSLGFSCRSNFGRNSSVWFRATRNGTTVEFKDGRDYDEYCIIKFQNQAELDAFIDSLYAAHWEKWGHIFEHRDNNAGKVYAKVNGLTVTLISPYEMLPNNF